MTFMLTLAAFCATTLAQQAPQELKQTGRALSFGGSCDSITISSDQHHALTVGDYGDLVWWDLKKQTVLLHITPPARHISALAIHPNGTWAAVGCSSSGWQGRVYGADLRSGECFLIGEDYAHRLAFDESGDSLAVHTKTDIKNSFAFYDARQWPLGCPKPEREVDSQAGAARFTNFPNQSQTWKLAPGSSRSANGVHSAEWKGDKLQTSFGDCIVPIATETWLDNAAVTNDGTLLVCDAIGQVLLLDNQSAIDIQANTRTPFAPHIGHADRLVFSRDGRHLAIQGLCATRIVALDGTVELQLSGTHLIEAGGNGGDFLIADRHRCYHWNADSRTEVGEQRCWQRVQPGFLADGHLFGRGVSSVWRVRAGITALEKHKVGKQRFALDVLPQTQDDWRPVSLVDWITRAQGLHRIGRSGAWILHATTLDFMSERSPSTFYRLDANGDVTHHTPEPSWHSWLAIDAQSGRIWLGGGALHGMSTQDLSPITSFTPDLDWLHAVAWQGGDLLMTDGAQLHVVEPMEEYVRRTFARPADLAEIDLIAASPDRSHIAIADDYDVRILKVPK